jgi:hypothetical protein
MTKIEIKSHPGTFIKLDDNVAEKIGGWGWYLLKRGYAMARIRGNSKKMVRISRAVIWASTGEWPPTDMVVDHINHDLLDNQISNLRVVTQSLNMRNRIKNKKTISKYKGVGVNKRNMAYIGYITLVTNGESKRLYGSRTKNQKIAGMARDCLADLIGGFLRPNFPHMTFKEKWEYIGEGQRNRILHSLTNNGITPKVV